MKLQIKFHLNNDLCKHLSEIGPDLSLRNTLIVHLNVIACLVILLFINELVE